MAGVDGVVTPEVAQESLRVLGGLDHFGQVTLAVTVTLCLAMLLFAGPRTAKRIAGYFNVRLGKDDPADGGAAPSSASSDQAIDEQYLKTMNHFFTEVGKNVNTLEQQVEILVEVVRQQVTGIVTMVEALTANVAEVGRHSFDIHDNVAVLGAESFRQGERIIELIGVVKDLIAKVEKQNELMAAYLKQSPKPRAATRRKASAETPAPNRTTMEHESV